MSSDLSTGKTIFILAVVVGCFAVLWPKVFYPMLTASVKQSAATQESLPHPHVRPERPSHLHPEALHPALREKGRTLPHRTIEKQARPGPMPGVRPPMGGGGHMVPPQTKGSGAMGIIMPLYTVGIVIFFVYTIMKVLFKKSDEEDNKVPKLKDFHLDPEYRKYVFAEEYLDSSNASHRDLLKRQERESSKQRRRQDSASQPDTKIEDEQMDQLRRRLEETEKAMERLMSQMGSVTDKLTAAKITEVLSQAQSQARILKEQESAFKRSTFDTHESDMNHKEEDDDFSEFEEASDKELIKQDLPEEKNIEKEKKDKFSLQEEQIKEMKEKEEISVESVVKENGALKNIINANDGKDFAEERNEKRFSEIIKKEETNINHEKFVLNENKTNGVNEVEMNKDLRLEELQIKPELKERGSKKCGRTKEINDLTTDKSQQPQDIECDRLENVGDLSQENITITTRLSPSGTNQGRHSVTLSTHDTEQSE